MSTADPEQTGQAQNPPHEVFQLQALSFHEKAIIDAYTEALKNGLSAAADANGVLITAALAIATLYGTLIGLVSPKNQASPFIIVLPMIPLIGAFMAAVYGKTGGISFGNVTTTDQVRNSMTEVVGRQRKGMRISVALLTIGLIVGGYILADVYGGPQVTPASVTAYLTPKGRVTIWTACQKSVTTLTGTVGTSPAAPQDIVLIPAAGSPCSGQRLELSPQDVAAVK